MDLSICAAKVLPVNIEMEIETKNIAHLLDQLRPEMHMQYLQFKFKFKFNKKTG